VFSQEELCRFLCIAKRSTYAAGDRAQKFIEADTSTTLIFEDGDWKYHDNYFGGEPFGGREVVFLKDRPIFIMTYYGGVDGTVSDIGAVYGFLRTALLLMPEAHPFRGPDEFSSSNFDYRNSYSGEISCFWGEETINSIDGTIIYRARYAGGLVDRRSSR